MTLYKTTARWSGFSGAPGYTTFHFQGTGDGLSAQACIDKTHAFFQTMGSFLANGVTVQVSGEVELIDEATGQLESYETGTQPALVGGPASQYYSAASGACITWDTGGVRNGRRVRGRTFLVPLSATAYDNAGTLSPAALTDLNAAANGLRAAEGADLMIFARPSAPGASDGMGYWVTGHRISDKVAVLTSRRD